MNFPTSTEIPKRLTPYSAWHEHIPFAMSLVQALKPAVLVELGTHWGDSYCAFCQAVETLQLGTCCYAIDTWKGDAQTGFYGTEILDNLRAHHDPLYGGFSTLVQSTFDDALQYFRDGTIDLLHIDGLHTYEAVKHDFEAWQPKLSQRAVVLFHDSNVRERQFGVWHLWDELKLVHRHFEFLHGHGLGVLAVGPDQPPLLSELYALSGAEIVRIREVFFCLGRRLSVDIQRTERIRQLEVEKASVWQDHENLKGRCTQLETEKASVWQDRENLKGRCTQLETEKASVWQDRENLKGRCTQLETEKASVWQDHENLKGRFTQLETDKASLGQDYENLKGCFKQLEGEKTSLVQEHENLKIFTTQLQAEKVSMSKENEVLRVRAEELEVVRQALDSDLEGLKYLIEQLNARERDLQEDSARSKEMHRGVLEHLKFEIAKLEAGGQTTWQALLGAQTRTRLQHGFLKAQHYNEMKEILCFLEEFSKSI